jgi:hypothetical protein
MTEQGGIWIAISRGEARKSDKRREESKDVREQQS